MMMMTTEKSTIMMSKLCFAVMVEILGMVVNAVFNTMLNVKLLA